MTQLIFQENYLWQHPFICVTLHMEHQNRPVFIISAPSGSGKTTMVKQLLERFDCFGGTITNDDDVTFGQFVGEHRASVERLNGSVVGGDSVVVVHYRAKSIQLKRRDVHDIAYKSIFIEYRVFLVHTCA